MPLGLIRQYQADIGEFVDSPYCNPNRFQHTWLIGKTGTGKSTALENYAIHDILNGEGVIFFDPHGDSADTILRHIPPRRRNDVVLFAPHRYPIAFNIFDTVPEERRDFVANSVVDCFHALWPADIATVNIDQFVYAGSRALMDAPNSTLLGLKFLITSSSYRSQVMKHVSDPMVREFWETDFSEHMPEREQRDRTLSTLMRVANLVSDPAIRNCIGQARSRLDLRGIIDRGQILIVSIPQGKLGAERSALIGALLLSQLHLAALERGSGQRAAHIYVDECHLFGAETLCQMLSGIRKFGVSLTLAHQYLDQLQSGLQSALKGESPTLIFPNGFRPELYLFNARNVGDGELYLVRDPLDVLIAHQNGITNVVAFLTLTVSPEQLHMLASMMDERRIESVELH